MLVPTRQLMLALIACLLWLPELAAQSRFSTDQQIFFARRQALMDFEDIDLGPLIQAGRQRNPQLDEQELEQVIRSNIHFVFYNQLDRSRFVVTPPPRQVVEKVQTALATGRKLRKLVEDLRRLNQRGHSSRVQAAQSIRSMEQESRRLRNIFRRYFREYGNVEILLEYERSPSVEGDFDHFLRQADPLVERLENRLADYFLKAPSVVTASEFNSHSVAMLSDALMRLSRMALRRPD
ncbi:MAG TPA: hypothetical protein VLU25_20145 [Acidobacteriota bacterium]|nr:hypothetical protein [Acidobacteriota bacterium]